MNGFPSILTCCVDDPREENAIRIDAESHCEMHGESDILLATLIGIPQPGISRERSGEWWCAPASRVPDAVLMDRITAGDESALAALYTRYASLLLAMLLRILQDTGAAEEVLQDLFLEVWRQAARFDPNRGSPLAWLLVIGRSRALSRLRVRRRRELFEATDFPIEAIGTTGDFENEMARLCLTEKLRLAMRELPPSQKEALELAYFEGMTQSEIAHRTASALGTVKSRVRAAMRRLKGLIAEEQASRT